MDGISPSSSASNAMPGGMVYCAAPEFPPVERLVDMGMAASECLNLLNTYYAAYGKYVGVVSGDSGGSEVSVRSYRRGKRGSGVSRAGSTVSSDVSGVGTAVTEFECGSLSQVRTFRDLANVAVCDVDDKRVREACVTRIRFGEYHLAKHGVSLLSVLGALCDGPGFVWPLASVGGKYAKSTNVVMDELVNLDCGLGGCGALACDPPGLMDLCVTVCAGDQLERKTAVALIKKKANVISVSSNGYADAVKLEACDLSLLSACLGSGYRLWHEGAYVFALPAYRVSDDRLGVGCMPALPGLCYLEMVVPDRRCEAVFSLGFDPTVEQLLTMDSGWVVDQSCLLQIGVLGDGSWHMYEGYRGPFDNSLLAKLLGVVRLVGRGCPATLAEWLCDGYATTLPDVPVASRDVLQYCVGSGGAARAVLSHIKAVPIGSKDVFESNMHVAMRAQAMLDSSAKNKLRVLAGVGDAALTLYVANLCLDAKTSAQAYQELRSKTTKNEALAALFRTSELRQYLVCAGEVTAKVGGEAMEAVLGAVYRYYGMPGLGQALEWLGFEF